MKKLVFFLVLVVIIFVLGFCSPLGAARCKMTVQVFDEAGQPISNANVSVGFNSLQIFPLDLRKTHSVKGVTDREGKFTAKSATLPIIGFTVKKDGYYDSGESHTFSESKFGRWTPYNLTFPITLRKIENPVPMYAKKVETEEIPVFGKPVGFDLLMGDWVIPHGKGKVSDLVFTLQLEYRGVMDYDGNLTIEMPRDGDGFVGISVSEKCYQSDFILPRYAPENGYKPAIEMIKHVGPGTPTSDVSTMMEEDFFIRVRTVKDKNGNIKEALYGKIISNKKDPVAGIMEPPAISYRIRDKDRAYINFTYYINPDKTRNMEFDPEKNLLKEIHKIDRYNDWLYTGLWP